MVRHLARTVNCLPEHSRRLLYDALACPHFNYADVVWDGCLKQQQIELQRIHNFAGRVIAGVDKRHSSGAVLESLGMLPLTEKRKIHQAVFVHKILNGRGPDELCNKLQQAIQNTSLNLRSKDTLFVAPKQHNTAKFERSTVYKSTKVWNTVRPTLRLIEDSSKFKVECQREMSRAFFGASELK